MKFDAALVRMDSILKRFDADFKEEDHPRGEEGSSKGGLFVKKGEGGGAAGQGHLEDGCLDEGPP